MWYYDSKFDCLLLETLLRDMAFMYCIYYVLNVSPKVDRNGSIVDKVRMQRNKNMDIISFDLHAFIFIVVWENN